MKGQKQLWERAVTQGPSPLGNRRCREGSSAQCLLESLGETLVSGSVLCDEVFQQVPFRFCLCLLRYQEQGAMPSRPGYCDLGLREVRGIQRAGHSSEAGTLLVPGRPGGSACVQKTLSCV